LSQSVFKQYPSTFWIANVMEIFERMAWYGFFAVSSLYITGSIASGGLGFSSEDRGLLQGVVSFFVYLLPFLTGALGDRYGYKKMLIIAYCILSPAYYFLGQFKTFPTFFAAFALVAIGAAIFKPLIVSTVGLTTNKKNASLGFGIFYMMVNIGGFAGPFVAAAIRNEGWQYVFIASSIWIACNIPIVLIFFKEPTVEAGSEQKRSFSKVMTDMIEVLGNGRFFLMIFVLLFICVMGSKWLSTSEMFTWAGIWLGLNLLVDLGLGFAGRHDKRMQPGNKRFLLFLLLLSSFWVSFNQIFITLPEYIRDFCDTKPMMDSILQFLGSMGLGDGSLNWIQNVFAKEDGSIKPEHFVNINAMCIIFLQLIVSATVAKLKPLITIMIGIGVTGLSFIMLMFGVSPLLVIFAVAIFSVGEMLTSPKAKEYTAHAVAPPDKVALYMGYYMWSNALGGLFGGILSGQLYGHLARDMNRPDLMWLVFAGLAILCAVLIFVYHKLLGKKLEEEHARLSQA